MKTTKEKILEVLNKYITRTVKGGDYIVASYIDELASELESLQEDKTDFPDIDFRKDIAGELSRDELINRLCEMHENYQKMRKEWFEKCQLQEDKPRMSKGTLPESFKTLFNCLQDSCYEINFYGNDGNDNQERINGKELLIKWITDAYFDSNQPQPTDEEIEKWAIKSFAHTGNYEVNIAYGAAKAMRDGLINKE
jgi:hypothetical protein